jgi:hypothetical protein
MTTRLQAASAASMHEPFLISVYLVWYGEQIEPTTRGNACMPHVLLLFTLMTFDLIFLNTKQFTSATSLSIYRLAVLTVNTNC